MSTIAFTTLTGRTLYTEATIGDFNMAMLDPDHQLFWGYEVGYEPENQLWVPKEQIAEWWEVT